jgi:hypothetical protein
MNEKDVISVWAKKILAKCDQINEKEKAIEFAKRYGFLRGSIEILVDGEHLRVFDTQKSEDFCRHPEDIEFLAKTAGKGEDMDEKKNKEKLDK